MVPSEDLMEGIKQDLLNRLQAAAVDAKARAHAPYSGYSVGAAVLADGNIFFGCNVENASYPAGICAERAAVAAAVAAGCRNIEILAVAVNGDPAPPCGICLQFLSEFARPGMPVLMIGEDRVDQKKFSDLFPTAFSL